MTAYLTNTKAESAPRMLNLHRILSITVTRGFWCTGHRDLEDFVPNINDQVQAANMHCNPET